MKNPRKPASLCMIKIDNGIPIPDPLTSKKYPFKHMDVGDSFLSSSTRGSLYAAATRDGVKITVRKMSGGGCRCWRTA
jgi:hypothetical protein